MPTWFQQYVSELESAQSGVLEKKLIDDLLATRRAIVAHEDSLNGSLPSEVSIKNWPNAKGETLDGRNALLLYYHELKTYGLVTTRTVQGAISEFRQASNAWGGASHILRILTQEAAMRGVWSFPRRDNTWAAQASSLRSKYSGFYVLLRLNSEKQVVSELLGIETIPDIPKLNNNHSLGKRALQVQPRQVLKIRWLCEDEPWAGDLIIGRDKFAGLVLKDLIFDLPNPMTVTVLRHEEAVISSATPTTPWIQCPILTGLVVGANSKHPEEIFRTPIFLYQLQNTEGTECNLDTFERLAESSKRIEFFANLNRDKGPIRKNVALNKVFSDKNARLYDGLGQNIFGTNTACFQQDVSEWITPCD